MDGFPLEIFAILFGLVVGVVGTWACFRKQLFTDPLTSLPNQNAVSGVLLTSLRRVRREKAPLCIALVDLDNFKAVNTEFGYTCADQILAEFAEVLRTFSRSHRIHVLRYRSGDEFLLIMEGVQVKRAYEIIEALKEAIQEKTFTSQDKQLRICLSAGIANLDGFSNPSTVNTSFQNLIDACEKDLFAAKAKRTPSDR